MDIQELGSTLEFPVYYPGIVLCLQRYMNLDTPYCSGNRPIFYVIYFLKLILFWIKDVIIQTGIKRGDVRANQQDNENDTFASFILDFFQNRPGHVWWWICDDSDDRKRICRQTQMD